MPLEALIKNVNQAPVEPGVLARPIAPSAALHNAIHTNARGPASWCDHCINGKAKDNLHSSRLARDTGLGEKAVEIDCEFCGRE